MDLFASKTITHLQISTRIEKPFKSIPQFHVGPQTLGKGTTAP